MPTLQLYLKPSPLLARLVWLSWLGLCLLIVGTLVTHVIVSNAWPSYSLATYLTLNVWMSVSYISTKRWLKQHAWQDTDNAIVALNVSHNHWTITLKTGIQMNVLPYLGSRFWPWLTLVRMHDQAKQQYWVIILPDRVCADAWRQLRVRGRWDPHFATKG